MRTLLPGAAGGMVGRPLPLAVARMAASDGPGVAVPVSVPAATSAPHSEGWQRAAAAFGAQAPALRLPPEREKNPALCDTLDRMFGDGGADRILRRLRIGRMACVPEPLYASLVERALRQAELAADAAPETSMAENALCTRVAGWLGTFEDHAVTLRAFLVGHRNDDGARDVMFAQLMARLVEFFLKSPDISRNALTVASLMHWIDEAREPTRVPPPPPRGETPSCAAVAARLIDQFFRAPGSNAFTLELRAHCKTLLLGAGFDDDAEKATTTVEQCCAEVVRCMALHHKVPAQQRLNILGAWLRLQTQQATMPAVESIAASLQAVVSRMTSGYDAGSLANIARRLSVCGAPEPMTLVLAAWSRKRAAPEVPTTEQLDTCIAEWLSSRLELLAPIFEHLLGATVYAEFSRRASAPKAFTTILCAVRDRLNNGQLRPDPAAVAAALAAELG